MANAAVAAATKTVSVSMLGGLQLQVDNQTITDNMNRSKKLWGVLCYFIIHRNRPIPQSELIEQFWPEEERASPVNALKTLLYRIRAILYPVFGEDVNPILARQGAYQWNPDLICKIDTEDFERVCMCGKSPFQDDDARMDCYRQAIELYRSSFLPNLNHYMWVISLNARYHSMYLDAVKDFALLLEKKKQYDAMITLCTKASQQESLDEGLYVLIIRALICQGRDLDALSQYEAVTDLLYRSLGVQPSDELRSLYNEIMKSSRNAETDLETIQEDLKEAYFRSGAFVCEYGFFKEAYRLESRRIKRSGLSGHVALITIAQPHSDTPPLELLNTSMALLLDILVASLRRGDVISRFSGTQFVVLLHAANFENSIRVLDRICASFQRHTKKISVKLSYKVRELDFSK